jgi:hypothetical protein
MSPSRFVADGRDRILEDPKAQSELAAAIAEITVRYAPALADASFLRRLVLRSQLRREIREAIERQAPTSALYLTASPPNRQIRPG